MENKFELKPFDKVLVRDKETAAWQIDLYEKCEKSFSSRCYRCLVSSWVYCIPYEGNEHLLGTTDKPERRNQNENILFGIELKPGYVLEFEDGEAGILFPTANGFAVSCVYIKGLLKYLKSIKEDSIVRIMGIASTDYLRSGEILWEKPKKKTFTKAEIAEKLGMKAQDFELIEEDNEENE